MARLVFACVRMLRNRRALRELDAARLDDCGIGREALGRAIDWRFWRRLDEMPVQAHAQAAGSARQASLTPSAARA